MWKLRKTVSDPQTHEDIFVRQYPVLIGWALRLTNNDKQRAEDLVQDAFVQFTFTRPELDGIQNIEGYLYGMLRNLHLLDLRRATRHQAKSLSIIDFDSAELGVRGTDLRMQIQTQEELYRICYYACQRRKSSKTGSVLLLRFFHGYFPNEIALIIRASRPSVSELLRLARNEAKLFLENPSAIGFIADSMSPEITEVRFSQDSDRFLAELSGVIFRSRRGDCLSANDLKNTYIAKESAPIEAKLLEHIVCCSTCLDTVNRTLGLPLLAERSPVDSLGPDTRSKGGPGNSGGSASGGSKDLLAKLRRKAKQVFEHRPRELCISVNGDIQVWQTISSPLSEQTVSLDENERVDLIDVTSEQGVRLLYLSVNQIESGPVEQSTVVKLSDKRTLQVSLDHTGLRAQLRVAYYDPDFLAQNEAILIQDNADYATPADRVDDAKSNSEPNSRWHKFADWSFWLRPGMVTAVIAIVAIAVISVFVIFHDTSLRITPATLLNRAINAESMTTALPGQAVHRTVNFEERGPSGELIRRQRLEIWENTSTDHNNSVKIRRLFDENNRLIAGDWIKADGSGFVYRNGAKLTTQNDKQQSLATLLDTDTLWRLDLSAKDFGAMVGPAGTTRVEDDNSSYVLNYQAVGPVIAGSSGFRLVKASLTLSKSDLHAVKMNIQVAPQSGNARSIEYIFIESGLERRSLNDLPPNVFEPDPALLRSSDSSVLKNDSEQSNRLPRVAPDASLVATTELEILERLNGINALSGDQVSLKRTSEGLLRVQGIVETEQRKSEFLHALASFKNDSFVKIEIQTAAEATRHRSRNASDAISTESVEVDKATIPADGDLQAYLARTRGLSGASLDQEVHSFAEKTLEQARQSRRQALALKQIAEQFSMEDLRSLNPVSHSKWKEMLRSQARRVQQDLNRLHQELQPIFLSGDAGESGSTFEIGSDNDLSQACNRLFDLVLSTDDAISRSFSIYSDGAKMTPIKSSQFWHSLGEAEKLAGKLADGQ